MYKTTKSPFSTMFSYRFLEVQFLLSLPPLSETLELPLPVGVPGIEKGDWREGRVCREGEGEAKVKGERK